jgi:ketopantoate reductase
MTRVLVWGGTPLAARLADGLRPRHDVSLLADDPLPDAPLPEVVLLVAQSWQTASAMTQLRAALPFDQPAPVIASLQMGRGSRQTIDAMFGADHALVGAFGADDGFVLANAHPQSATVSALLTEAGFLVTTAPAESIEWSSVFWGIQGNALGAILDIPPESVYNNPAHFAIEQAQLLEALGIIRAAGSSLVALPGVNVPAMARQLGWIPRRWVAPFLRKYPRPPSLREELSQQKGRSEAAYLNGAVALQADELHLRAPINHALALIVTDIAEGRALWSQYKGNPALLEATIRLAR